MLRFIYLFLQDKSIKENLFADVLEILQRNHEELTGRVDNYTFLDKVSLSLTFHHESQRNS